jgi:hypothetical protein
MQLKPAVYYNSKAVLNYYCCITVTSSTHSSAIQPRLLLCWLICHSLKIFTIIHSVTIIYIYLYNIIIHSAMKTKDSTHTSVIGFNTSVQTTMKNKFKIHMNIIAPPSPHFFLFFQIISFQDTGIPQLALLIGSRKTEH